MLRVGGRLQNSELLEDAKHPLLLPAKHHFTSLVFRHEHMRLKHCPPQQLLSSVRQRFWPLQGRRSAVNFVNRCMTCAKNRHKNIQQIMAPLPATRVIPQLPFTQIGLDYAGPMAVKQSKRKSAPLIKLYVCIFICLLTKAVHIETITDLSATLFLAVFKNFTSRRGIPSIIFSDNAKTFIGSRAYLQNIFQDILKTSEVQNYCAHLNIRWKLNPSYAKHFGGIWEAAFKCMKAHFSQ